MKHGDMLQVCIVPDPEVDVRKLLYVMLKDCKGVISAVV